MKRILTNTTTFLLILLMGISLASCINEHEACPVIEIPKNGFQIHFQIVTKPSNSTRAVDIDGDVEGSGAENYLNVKDIKYLIFDSNQNFICDISPEATTTVANAMYTLYDVVATVNDPYFIEGTDSFLNFYILVVANSTLWNITVPDIKAGDEMSTIFSNGLIMNRQPVEASQLMQAVENTTSAKLPMAGLQRFMFHGSRLLSTSEGIPFDLSRATGKNINMLRSLAKIEIIDKINIGDRIFDENTDLNGFRISTVEMNGFMSKGSLLPSLDQWGRNVTTPETQQVIAPSIPDESSYTFPPAFNANGTIGSSEGLSDYILNFAFDKVATDAREDKCPVFSCYVYEYQKQPLTTIPIAQQPYFTVKIKGSDDPEIESAIFPMRMAQYDNGTTSQLETLDNLLRNHIYRFEITGIQQNLTVNWTVCEMDQATTEIVFN